MGIDMGLHHSPFSTKAPHRAIRRQRGAVLILFAVLLLLILGFMGLAIDSSRMFNRKVELQAVADFAAMEAAQKLVGTPAGIDEALAAAAAATSVQKYQYGNSSNAWSDAAIKFAVSPTSGWLDVSVARDAPGNIKYAKVETADLAADSGAVATTFMKVLSPDLLSKNVSASAVAGRTMVNFTPLAICAMSASAAVSRPPSGELVEYGFRRGVAYDLMQLNSSGTSPVNFVINPIDAGGSPAGAGNTAPDVVGPFVCAGSMPAVGGVGGQLSVSQPFPLASLYEHLNSRFGQYAGGACDFRSAPPDTNIKSFVYNASSSWMKSVPGGQGAQSLVNAGRLQTVADPQPHPAGNTAAMYGQMWAYARPVPFSAYTPGVPEPGTGYTPFAPSAWPALYAPGSPEPKGSYPLNTPYMYGMPQHQAPSVAYGRPLRHRRVLNVPLVACPVAGSNADVLAIGRFFMAVPATSTSLYAEFAGIASGQALWGTVELYK